MGPLELDAEVLLAAFGVYAAIVVVLTLWNARQARLGLDRRGSRRLDETGPGGHVLHERRSQALVGQVFGGDR
jgi:hypothetical protein